MASYRSTLLFVKRDHLMGGLDPGQRTNQGFGCKHRRRESSNAGSDAELPALVQARSRSASPVLLRKDHLQIAKRLGNSHSTLRSLVK